MVTQQEMLFQLAALQRQRDTALYQVVLAEARIGMLEAELAVTQQALKDLREKQASNGVRAADRNSMTEP